MYICLSYVGFLSIAALVEGLEEVGLSLEHNFVMEIVPVVAGDVLTAVSSLGGELIGDVGTPDISILHIVKTLVAFLAEGVDALDVPHFVVLHPVLSKLEFGLVGSGVFAHAVVSDNPRHKSAVLTEQA